MKTIYTLLLNLPLLLLADISFATESGHTATIKTLSNSPMNSGALLETVLGLCLVLGIIAALAWLIRRTGHFSSAAHGEMKIIAGLSLGPREKAMLLQVGEQQVLVGVTTHNINTLYVLEQNINTENKNESDVNGFADKLQQMMKKQGGSL